VVDVSPRDRLDRGDDVAGSDDGGLARLKRSADILVVVGLALASAAAAAVSPAASTARVVLAGPSVLLAPGYLLLQALLVPTRSRRVRGRHLLFSLGLSPALVGLLALSTAIVPGGFKRAVIAAVVTVGCVAFAGVGLWRRWSTERVLAGEDEDDVTQTA
jgi:uncharacterized membrane protein